MERIFTTNDSKVERLAYTVDEFAAAAHLSKPVVFELVHADGFPAIRVGKRWLIPCKAAEEWLNKSVGKEFLR